MHLADMRAAACLREAPLVLAHCLEVTSGHEALINLGRGLTLVLTANHAKPPKLLDGNLDWMKVERVLVQRIEDSNG